jgi:hypothetical protein
MNLHESTSDNGSRSQAAARDRWQKAGPQNGRLVLPGSANQLKHSALINGSPYMLAQRKWLHSISNQALQKQKIALQQALVQGSGVGISADGMPLRQTALIGPGTRNASAGGLHPVQFAGSVSNWNTRGSSSILMPAGPSLIQRYVSPVDAQSAVGGNQLFWVLKPKRDYLKQANILEVHNEGDVEAPDWQARVRFVQGDEEARVALDDIYPQDSDELEDYPAWMTAKGTLKRLTRKAGSGTAMGDVFNTAGVVSATSALVSESSGWFITGIVSGVGVGLGGAAQIIRALSLSDKSAADRTLEGAKGTLNILSGGLGIAANILGLQGASESSTVFGIFSLDAWIWAELMNIIDQGPGAISDLADKQVTPRVASVLFSGLKIIGGNVLVNGAAFAANPAIIAGMVLAGGGTLGGFILGMIKLSKMAYHHWSKNRPVEQGSGESGSGSGLVLDV